jgi:4-diphosphocytidyl-2-C-methyl-D-erythritol kinase
VPAANNAAGPLHEPAPAKVNLFLRVVGRRADGYHLLESLAVFAGIGDLLYAAPAADLSLSLTGPFAPGLAAEADNLVLRAARALADATGHAPTARITLEKHLPVASGIGGGSADAAAACRLLTRLWAVPEAGPMLAVKLGADVPVCLPSQPAIMRGIGDELTPAPTLPPYGLALVNPGIGVSTAEIFRARAGGFAPPLAVPSAWPTAAAMAADLAAWGNDLQIPAAALCPPITSVLAALRAQPNCLLAQMSGSGATCFGVFPSPEAAEHAANALRQPGWWSWGGAPYQADRGSAPELQAGRRSG